MKISRRLFFSRFIYSFPIQLFVLLFKKNQVLLFYWFLLFAMVTGFIGKTFGITFLFLDPEYMSKVSFISFFVMGFACGCFIMVFNISSYIINGFRFSFIATLSKPFMKYALNNFIVPLLFVLVYLSRIFYFQYVNELQSILTVISYMLAYLLGLAVIISFTLSYFFRTNKDIIRMYNLQASDADPNAPLADHIKGPDDDDTPFTLGELLKKRREWRVDTYLATPRKVKLVRKSDHYGKDIVDAVFRQNHLNAAIIEIVVFGLFILMGLFKDYTLFKIPAGASVMLLFSMLIMLSSAIRFWLKAWSAFVLIFFILTLNFLSQFGIFYTRNKAYGLDYESKPVRYDIFSIEQSISKSDVRNDSLEGITTLNTWRNKFYNQTYKPKLVLINVTGGGSRASMWAFRVMQHADSMTQNRFLRSTQLISGASGGMIGAAYYRELFLKEQLGIIKNFNNNTNLFNTAKDLLNPIAFSITVSDLFFNIQQYKDGKNTYSKDRAYSFEKQMNENFGNVFSKRLRDYAEPEKKSVIPMMIFAPTIVTDGRRLIMSPLNVSYLTKRDAAKNVNTKLLPDDIEYGRFFHNQDALNIKFTSVLRMNATFPYVLPAVTLPTDPLVKVMDAGIRDNFGYKTSMKYLYQFRTWIEENTSGVIFIEIRDTHKFKPVDEKENQRTLFENILTPLGNIYNNLLTIQEYLHDEDFTMIGNWYKGKIDVLRFELPTKEQDIGLSWHLTTREKNTIYNSTNIIPNKYSFERLNELLKNNN